MRFFALVALISRVFSQAAGGQSLLLAPPQIRTTGNYSIGYLPSAALGTANSYACRRISMFKFPAAASGVASSLTVNVLPDTVSQACDIGVSLFTFPDSVQVGSQYVGAFSGAPTSQSEQPITVNVIGSNWSLLKGSEYYFQIQTSTWNTVGRPCSFRLPYGVDTAIPPTYAVVAGQGPVNQPCGTTPWTTVSALDGGFLHMSLVALPSATSSRTSSVSVTSSPSVTVTSSPSVTVTSSPSVTVTSKPSVTVTSSPSATTSPTSISFQPPSITPSNTSSQTSTPASRNTTQVVQPPPLQSQAQADMQPHSPTTISLGIIAASVCLIGLVYTVNKYRKNAQRHNAQLFTPAVVVDNPAQVVTHQYSNKALATL